MLDGAKSRPVGLGTYTLELRLCGSSHRKAPLCQPEGDEHCRQQLQAGFCRRHLTTANWNVVLWSHDTVWRLRTSVIEVLNFLIKDVGIIHGPKMLQVFQCASWSRDSLSCLHLLNFRLQCACDLSGPFPAFYTLGAILIVTSAIVHTRS